MKPALILLALLTAVGVALWLHDRLTRRPDTLADPPADSAAARACANDDCLLRGTCPTEQLLRDACADDKPVYYDDEELDAFRDRDPQQYTSDELEQWRDVLYTLRPADRPGWLHSLSRRGLRLPDALQQELLMLLDE